MNSTLYSFFFVIDFKMYRNKLCFVLNYNCTEIDMNNEQKLQDHP